MSKKKRRKFSATQKATILKRHLVEKIPVSQVCDEADLQPSLFYLWQKQAFENLELGLENQRRPAAREKAFVAKIEHLEERLARKDEVIAEVSEDYVTLKKRFGRV